MLKLSTNLTVITNTELVQEAMGEIDQRRGKMDGKEKGRRRQSWCMSKLMMIKLVLSVSMFSILFFHNIYLYGLVFQLVTHGVDKNYIFLLCNGLLVFVAKCSSLTGFCASPEPNYCTVEYKCLSEGYKGSNPVQIEQQHTSEKENGPCENEREMERIGLTTREEEYVYVEEEIVLHEESHCLFDERFLEETSDEDEDGEEEEEGHGLLNAEELNKKFDEFIRKMKEELTTEPRIEYLLEV